MPVSPGITSSVNSMFLWRVHLGMAPAQAHVVFCLPIKGHVDRLRLLLVCASLMYLKADDEHGGALLCTSDDGVSEGLRTRATLKRERSKSTET